MTEIRTASEAARLLFEYEQLNLDIPKDTRRIMGAFAIAYRVGQKALGEIFGDLKGLPFIHRSWFYWNAMKLSGLGINWDPFADMKNRGVNMGECLGFVKTWSDSERWSLFKKRLGKPEDWEPVTDRNKNRKPHTIWTKGGVWHLSDNFTQICILGNSIERIYPEEWMQKLGETGCQRLEKELLALIDPDTTLHPDAHIQAYEHVATRVPQLIKHAGFMRHKRMGPHNVSWFFGTRVWFKGKWYDWKNLYYNKTLRTRPRYVEGRNVEQSWEWF